MKPTQWRAKQSWVLRAIAAGGMIVLDCAGHRRNRTRAARFSSSSRTPKAAQVRSSGDRWPRS